MRNFLGTWYGRIILVNAVLFAILSYKSGSILLPDADALIAMGVKDPARLAQGELWRLITPMFLHIGIVHFAVNSYMLSVVGKQLEPVLGGRWFLLIYLASGFGGNVASAVFSTTMSAGASGALFGLLGAGLFLERSIGRKILETTGRKPQNRAYLVTVVVNLAFGWLIAFIDNSAHVGGLVTGMALTAAMVNLRPNTLQTPRKNVGYAILTVLVVVAVGGTYLAQDKSYLVNRLENAGDASKDPEEQIAHYSEAISIAPNDPALRLRRAKALFAVGDAKYAYDDLRALIEAKPDSAADLSALAEELSNKGKINEAWQVRRLSEHGAN